jgi:hypothetical protein
MFDVTHAHRALADKHPRADRWVRCMTNERGIVLFAIVMLLLPLLADGAGPYAVVYERTSLWSCATELRYAPIFSGRTPPTSSRFFCSARPMTRSMARSLA